MVMRFDPSLPYVHIRPTAIPRGNRKLQIQKDTCRTQQPPVDTFTGIATGWQGNGRVTEGITKE